MGDYHVPVLLDETIEGLDVKPDGIYLDCTAGGGGHSLEIAKRLSHGGRLIALDRDPDAVAEASKRLEGYNAVVYRRNYSELDKVIKELRIDGVDGILMDLGVSSHQLDTPDRGFSYHYDAPLDMRMSKDGVSAFDIVNSWSESQLAGIIFEYGEEKFSRKIAAGIIKKREKDTIKTTLELADIIKESVPAAVRRSKNPCKKTFQAIRIAVNGEFDHLKKGLECAFEVLKPHGRLAVITFHSLEDRIVKQYFASLSKGCICPPDFPQCVCGRKPRADLVNRKPVTASLEEVEANNRSRSAKLRIIERR